MNFDIEIVDTLNSIRIFSEFLVLIVIWGVLAFPPSPRTLMIKKMKALKSFMEKHWNLVLSCFFFF